jgi:hypothetical protein
MPQIQGIEKPEAVVDQDTDIPVQPADQFETVYDKFSHDGISDPVAGIDGLLSIKFSDG